ncbi:MAG: zinc dependent phospholipase C family protein [Bacteroidota bacterium]
MNRFLPIFLLLIFLPQTFAFSWGFWAHQRINRLAVFTLPEEMLVLYKTHLDFITEHAVDPDKRRYAVDGEAARHFIDIDHYGEFPFPNVPRKWNEAVAKFSEDTLMAYGNLPYHLPEDIFRLKKAFEEENLLKILKISSDIGHYVGDAHVPLHTTENYNGQMTGQKGIHGFWESRLPELFATDYDFFVGGAYFIEDILLEGWDAVLESHAALDSVLSFEANLNIEFPSDKKYGYESRNNIVVRAYSREYSQAYHEMLDGMVERRMKKAILRTGAYWYTAWKLAGSPDLSPLLKQSLKYKRPRFYKKVLKIIDREANGLGFLLPGQEDDLSKMCSNYSPQSKWFPFLSLPESCKPGKNQPKIFSRFGA